MPAVTLFNGVNWSISAAVDKLRAPGVVEALSAAWRLGDDAAALLLLWRSLP